MTFTSASGSISVEADSDRLVRITVKKGRKKETVWLSADDAYDLGGYFREMSSKAKELARQTNAAAQP